MVERIHPYLFLPDNELDNADPSSGKDEFDV